MKTKKLKVLLLTLPIVLSGCGNSSKGADVKIKFWHTFGQTVVDGLNTKIKKFKQLVKEHDGLTVDVELSYQGNYDDIAEKIDKGYSVGNKPTIAVAYPDNVADYLQIGNAAGDEFVVNLDTYINSAEAGFGKEKWLGDAYDQEDFVEDFFSEGSKYVKKGTYSLPYMKSTEIMFYNMTTLVEFMKGYKPEFNDSETQIKNYMDNLSWEEFVNLCTYIKAHMAEVSDQLQIPFAYDSDANLIISKMFQEGIQYTSISETGVASIEFGKGENLTKTTALLESLNDLYQNGLMTTKGIRGTYSSDFFTGEKCVFTIGSSGGSGYNMPKAGAFTLGVCKVPASNNNPLYVSQGPTLAMFNDAALGAEKNEQTKAYAWKFMKYITNGEVNADLCVNGSEGYIPVRYSAYSTQLFQEYMELGENYAKCSDVVVNKINSDCGYLVTDAFKGSAALRDACGSLLTLAIQVKDKSTIPGLINDAIDAASLKM